MGRATHKWRWSPAASGERQHGAPMKRPRDHRMLQRRENRGEGERRASWNIEGEREGWGETKAGKESGKGDNEEEKNTPTTETGGWQRETRGCENPNCVIFTAAVWGDNYKVTPEGRKHFLELNLCKTGGLDSGKVFPHCLFHYPVWTGHCQFVHAQHNKSGVVSLFHPEVQKQQLDTIRHHHAEEEAIKMIMKKLYRVFDPALEGLSNISFTISVHAGEKLKYYSLYGNASVFYGKPVSSVAWCGTKRSWLTGESCSVSSDASASAETWYRGSPTWSPQNQVGFQKMSLSLLALRSDMAEFLPSLCQTKAAVNMLPWVDIRRAESTKLVYLVIFKKNSQKDLISNLLAQLNELIQLKSETRQIWY